MIFSTVTVDSQAVGCILAHTHRMAGSVLRKGVTLTPQHIETLQQAGYQTIVAARLEPNDLAEDEAAARIAAQLTGHGVTPARALTGRCNLRASHAGLVEYEPSWLDQINLQHWQTTVGALAPYSKVEANQVVATVKIIPFAVPERILKDIQQAAKQGPNPGLRVHPFVPHRAGLVMSRLPSTSQTMLERAVKAQQTRLQDLGSTLDYVEYCNHTEQDIAQALKTCLAKQLNPVLFLGASVIVDPRDVFPMALRAIGGTVEHIGMPVEPGNMLVLGKHQHTTILGIPGCARSTKLSGFDWILQRVLCRRDVSPQDIMRMGAGGLLRQETRKPHSATQELGS